MLYSQRYYKEKFGRICSFGYNVDSFGHNGMLPQLLTLGGMDSYVMMRPDKGENPGLPTGLFRWQSPDGSVVTTFRLPFGYGDCSLHDFDGAERART
jgi:alpha-mannosidase